MLYSFTNQPTLVREGDEIVFHLLEEEIKYIVMNTHLHCAQGNGYIFYELGIAESYIEILKAVYGYKPTCGLRRMTYPQYKWEDYSSATRAINYFFSLVEKHNAIPIVKPKFTILPT